MNGTVPPADDLPPLPDEVDRGGPVMARTPRTIKVQVDAADYAELHRLKAMERFVAQVFDEWASGCAELMALFEDGLGWDEALACAVEEIRSARLAVPPPCDCVSYNHGDPATGFFGVNGSELAPAIDPTRRQRGRPSSIGGDEYERAASLYRQAQEQGRPTTAAVADGLGVSASTARKRIMGARGRGLLPPAESTRPRVAPCESTNGRASDER